MAGGKLTVEIGADITDFEKKIKEVEFDIKELSKVKLDQLKLGLDTTQINSQIKDAKQNLNSLKATVKDTGTSFAGMTPKVANGGNALMQFSRIAQDAPFGIMGIGNNITATAEAFSYLKQSTGSTGGALKALASSLMGTGGILLGVSLLTTGLTLLSQSGLSVGDIINKITGNFDDFGASIKKASEDAVKSTVGEISSLKELVYISQNETISKKQRIAAVDELQSKYPAYFGNLSNEKILTSDLTGTVNELTSALINKAIAENLTQAAIEPTLRLYRANAELLKLKKEEIIVEKQLSDAVERGDSARSLAFYSDNLRRVKDELNTTRSIIVQATNETNRLQDSINKIGGSASKMLIKAPKETKAKKTFVTPQVSGLREMISAPLVDVNSIAVFNGQIDALGNKVKELPNTIKASLAMLPEEVSASLVAMTQALYDFNSRASEIISGALVDTFAGIGNAIGNALANGGNVLSALGSTLLSSLGNVLTSMGKMAIEIGVGLLAIKTALKSLNPAVAIGAGVALIALGSYFSSKSASIGSGSGGGGASSSSGSGANNSSFSSSGFSGGGNNGGTVVFEIAGQKLIGVLSNTLNANRRLGGALGLG